MFGSELFRFPGSVDRIAEVEQSIDIAPARFVRDGMRGNSCSHRQTSNDDLFGAVLRSDFVENSSVASNEYLFRVGGPDKSPSRLHVWKVELDSEEASPGHFDMEECDKAGAH